MKKSQLIAFCDIWFTTGLFIVICAALLPINVAAITLCSVGLATILSLFITW